MSFFLDPPFLFHYTPPMKTKSIIISYVSGGYHGYDSNGFPQIVSRENAHLFENEDSALVTVVGDWNSYGFSGGALKTEIV